MARFSRAFTLLHKLEGFRSNHPNDPGGLTYYGISRRYWPQYYEDGPPSIDDAKEFYRKEFWNPLRLEELHDYRVSAEIFEQAVNLGHERASKFAQLSLNLVRQSKKLAVDGNIGPLTLAALNKLSGNDTQRYLRVLNGIQFVYYLFRTDQLDKVLAVLRTVADASQRVFFRGWLRRIGFGNADSLH